VKTKEKLCNEKYKNNKFHIKTFRMSVNVNVSCK